MRIVDDGFETNLREFGFVEDDGLDRGRTVVVGGLEPQLAQLLDECVRDHLYSAQI